MKQKRTVPGKLSVKQLDLIRLLCEGLPIEKATRAAKVGRTTAWRWMGEPEFGEALDRAKAAIFDTAIGELRTAALVAGRRLVALLDSENENTRRLTAVEILEVNFRVREAEGIEARLTRLEKIIKRNLGPHAVLGPDNLS